MVSNSRRTPWATPAASFIRRAASSKNRLLVWVIGASALLSTRQPNNGHRPPQSQEQHRGIVKPCSRTAELDFALLQAASPGQPLAVQTMPLLFLQFPDFNPVLIAIGPFQI